MPTVIEATAVSKRYRLGTARALDDTFRDLIVRSLKRPWARVRGDSGDWTLPAARSEFWALKDVSFSVEEGDVVGIIGRNGAGKSTLLKILSRITEPTEGCVRIRGRISSLLEVGTGFHPELTGRENIFLSGAMLGMRKAEIDAKLDEIVAFSEVDKFLDTPAKWYSSGMYLRLAFAVAAHLDPEVLIIDEVLAVGDTAFQKKCLGKMDDLREGGHTVLFVSHNLAAVENLCHRVLVLQQGRLVFGGTAKEAIDCYLHDYGSDSKDAESHIVDLRHAPGRLGRCQSLLERLELFTDGGAPVTAGLPIGAPLTARLHFRLEKQTASVDAFLGFNNLLGQRIFTAHSVFEPDRSLDARQGAQVFVCEVPSLTLVPGEYRIKVGLKVSGGLDDVVEDATRLTILATDYYGSGKAPWNGTVVMKHRWYLAQGDSHEEVDGPNTTTRS